MKTKAIMAALKSGRLTGALTACAIGIAAIVFPEVPVKWLFAAIGLCVGAAAVIKLVSSLAAGSLGIGYPGEIIESILLMLGAGFMALEAENASAAAAIAVGGILTVGSTVKLCRRIRLRNFGFNIGMLQPVTGILLGVIIMSCPVFSLKAAGILIGTVILAAGILKLVLGIRAGIAEYEYCEIPGVIEGKFVEL